MDTNLIDSCRETASGEANRTGSEATGEFKAFKSSNGDLMVRREGAYLLK